MYAPATVGVVAPTTGPTAGARGTDGSQSQRGARSTSGRSTIRSWQRKALPPAATASVASSVLSNFNGTSSNDSRKTNFNQEFEPPDQGLCVGNGYVLEPVNSAYRIFKTDGKTLEGPTNVNDLFDHGSTQFTSDPRCYYDPTTNTWFATILFLSGGEAVDGKSSQLEIAVNSSGNPENIWTQYEVDTTNAGGNGCPCFGDQPTLGIDQDNLYVTTNEFSILGPQFNGAQVYAFSKKDLVAGAADALRALRPICTSAGRSLAPCSRQSAPERPSAEFFLSTQNSNAGEQGCGQRKRHAVIAVWAMTNRTALQHGRLAGALEHVDLVGNLRPAARVVAEGRDEHSSTPVTTACSRRSTSTDRLWGELTSSVNDRRRCDRPRRCGVVQRPADRPATITSARRRRSRTRDTSSWRETTSSTRRVQALPSGNVAMVFAVTGADHFPSAAYAALGAGQSRFGAIHIVADGTGPYASHVIAVGRLLVGGDRSVL